MTKPSEGDDPSAPDQRPAIGGRGGHGTDEASVLAGLGRVDRSAMTQAEAAEVAALLVGTDSARVRNATSLILSDVRSELLPRALDEVLDRPGMMREAGTLVYAMLEAGFALRLVHLAHALEEGSFEARCHACEAIEAGLVRDADAAAEDAMRGVASALRDAGGADEAMLATYADEALALVREGLSPPRARP